MKKNSGFILVILLMILSQYSQAQTDKSAKNGLPIYRVKKIRQAVPIDADWNKRLWRNIEAIPVKNFIRQKPAFLPEVQAKMVYDAENLYLIFRVDDKFVKTVTTEINGPVWKDSAVEFFFSPDVNKPTSFFNFEINGSGVPLLGYVSQPRVRPTPDDIRQIRIAHSLPDKVDPEITGPVTWTVEFQIPLQMIRKYSAVTQPAKGVQWRANFYKIAEITSNPHYASWSVIDLPNPHFHTPQFFGIIEFQ